MPEKTTFLENAVLIILLLIVIGVAVVPVVWNHFRRGSVLQHGTEARARIMDVEDTGRRYNTNPVVRIGLMVTDDKGGEYRAEVTMPVSPVNMERYRPGRVVKVKYDPKRPEDVAIEDEGDLTAP